MKKYLDGEDQLVLWLSDKQSWMDRLEPIEFSEDEIKQMELVWQAFQELQEKLAARFGFNKFYV
jgi:hypothetical protein